MKILFLREYFWTFNCLSKLWVFRELFLCVFYIYLLIIDLYWRRGIINKMNKHQSSKFQIQNENLKSLIIKKKVKLNVELNASRRMINHKLMDDVSHLPLYTCAKPNSYIWRSLLTPVIWFQSQLLIWLSWIFRSFWL